MPHGFEEHTYSVLEFCQNDALCLAFLKDYKHCTFPQALALEPCLCLK